MNDIDFATIFKKVRNKIAYEISFDDIHAELIKDGIDSDIALLIIQAANMDFEEE